jgi:hypothetical protein
MKRGITLTLIAAAMLTAVNVNAETYFFSENGAGDMDGTTWGNAAPASYLGSSVENAKAGDTFYLMAGNYKPDSNTGLWVIPSGVAIRGGYPNTMTGTDTIINYATAGQSIFSADIDGDGVGDNGANVFMTIDNSAGTKATAAKTVLSGITIRDALNTTTTYYFASALVVMNGNLELDHVKILKNQIGSLGSDGKLVSAGAAVVVSGSYFYAHDCVWADNIGTRAGSALMLRGAGSKSGTADGEAKGTNPDKSIAYLDRCEFTNNVVIAPENSNAKYGGTMSVGDYCGTLYMNNCTATGAHILKAGAFCRLGGGCTLYSTNNTWFDFYCTATDWTSGDIMSCGSGSNLYIANTIAVKKEDTAVMGSKLVAFYVQANGVFESGGHNIWGTFTSEKTATLLPTDSVSGANTVSTVFGTNEYAANGGNGTKVIAAKESFRGMTVTDLKALATKWSIPSDKIDMTLDQRGYVRPEATAAGAYDVNAIAPNTSVNVPAANEDNFRIANVHNGNFKVIGTEGMAKVYDLTGKVVFSKNISNGEIINMSNLSKGLYVISINNKTVKVVR